MTASPFIVLAAGGTGGHVFPAEALATELGRRGCRLALVTDQRGGSLRGTPADVAVHRVMAAGMAGKSFAARLRGAPELALGTIQARRLLKRLAPDAVVGFGGYASVPTMLAAGLVGVPAAIHEQNAVLGRANRLLASRAALIAGSFAEFSGVPAESGVRIVHTGMPVRTEFAEARDVPYVPYGDDDPVNLLVLGGSQGARVFSHIVPEAVGALPESWRRRLRIVQQCRPEDLDAATAAYAGLGLEPELSTFFDNIPRRMADAHLVICRAGASTVAELTAVGRPAILVPYPHAIDDHQTANAHAVDEAGAGWLMPEDSFTGASLAARLESLFILSSTLTAAAACARAAGRPDAAARLADAVLDLAPNGATEDRRTAA